jgi:nicotinate-nucleotide adenylyltransferase
MQELVERNRPFLAHGDGVAYIERMNEQAERLGILGGTFNPIHHGHLIPAREAMESLDLDRLLLMPNARSPLRQGEKLASEDLRLQMVEAAVKDEPRMEACDLEVRRSGTSFLVDTLCEVKALHPEAALFFLMGADSLSTFDRWVRVEEIVDIAEVYVMPRPGQDTAQEVEALVTRKESLRGKLSSLPRLSQIDISATQVRERVRVGRSIRYLVPEGVEVLIRENGLYRDRE